MLIRALPPIVVLFLSAFAFADSSIQVQLSPGDYALFASQGASTGHPIDMVTSKGGTVSVPVPEAADHVYVWDRATDDLAVLSAKKLPPSWKVKGSDFKDLDSVTVAPEQGAQALAAGEVSIADHNPNHSVIVDASGPATFFDVKAGQVPITVRYRDAAGKSSTVSETFSIALDSPKSARSVSIAVPGAPAVATAQTPLPTAPKNGTAVSAPAEAPKKEQRANPIGVAIVYLVAVGVVVAIVYYGLQFMKGNPGPVSAKLAQLGVQVPQPGDQGLSNPTPVMPDPIRPVPVQKIVLADAAPDPIAPAAPAGPTGQPSLVSDSGVAIPLVEGETVVGREPGLGLSLTAETTVSRRHATMARSGQEVTLTDLGSSNGTFVNGTKVQSPVVLRAGDSVQFGSARFVYKA